MLFSRAAVDLSRSPLNYVAGLIRRHHKTIGSTWRLLNLGTASPARADLPAHGSDVPRARSRIRSFHRDREVVDELVRQVTGHARLAPGATATRRGPFGAHR